VPSAVVAAERRVLVKTVWGERVELATPQVQGDSLVGVSRGPRGADPQRRALALADVERVDVHRVAAGPTAAAIGLGVAGAFFALLVLLSDALAGA
jgi:hypothetical protein